ncbi:TRAP transporter substrate-binding protein [Halomonas dongshanensis]|uniref:TRAP transporter substrate-binding protein n=1 Tax=Halomonas dongshanensis TaxID=2890835 RepID=A0ABT2E8F7_9GAMM|nr:TRAP transporter substrate-binding protein [Halomonas dongshanensis]MCS2607841.1 TRAP transporter substrate-binding protein [Halomonas dongshanensis]
MRHSFAFRRTARAALGLSALTLLTAVLPAQAATTLRIMHFLPAMSNAQQQVIEPWCEELETRSEGELKCQIYPSMQLGGTPAQLADSVRNGVVDIGWTALGYSAGRFPRSEALELPFMLPAGGVDASRIAWRFSQEQAADDFREFKVLAVHSDGGSVFHTRETPISTLEDMNGLRLRASTRMASQIVDELGASAVSMPPAQIADTLAKGVIDGASASWEVVPPTKLNEVTFYHTDTANDQATPTVTVLAMLMNQRSYDRLPEAARQALDELSGEVLSERFGRAWDEAIARARDDVASDDAHTVITLDDEAWQAMEEATQGVAAQWMADQQGGIDRQALAASLTALVEEEAPTLEHRASHQ